MVYKAGMRPLVTFGKINEKILAAFDIKRDLYYAEFDADLLVKEAKHTISFSAPPRFPAVRRDLAIVLDKRITFRK
jgi:phenylalanyl-tRNA synthetase beta chain